MVYDANNAKLLDTSKFPNDSIFEGMIIDITDGLVSQFIKESAKSKWEGDLNSNAILVKVEVKLEDDKSETFEQMFTYIDENGETLYTVNSNMGKFNKKYETTPMLQQKVKVITDSNGFAKIKIE